MPRRRSPRAARPAASCSAPPSAPPRASPSPPPAPPRPRPPVPGPGARVSLPLMIEVEDNGPGVPDQLKPHLFDPFVTTKRTGSGLGLALVAKIIGDHGGVIECESVPRHTVFRVLLPLQDRRSPPPWGEGKGCPG